MCRNIRNLRRNDRAPEENELEDAALQFVRKITGYRQPSMANEAAFNQAIAQITEISQALFQELEIKGQSW
jgi:hypothetical protein